MTGLLILTLVVAALFFVLFMKYRQEAVEAGRTLVDAQAQMKALSSRLEKALKNTVPEDEAKAAWAAYEKESQELRHRLEEQRTSVSRESARLANELALLAEQTDLVDVGFRKRSFTYEDPKSYQEAIRRIENDLASMLKANRAAKCTIQWTVNGSDKQGEVMLKKLTKLAIRTFNADADAAIAKVKWNNLQIMEDRIRKSEETIERTLDKWGIVIDDRYRDVKLTELRLTYEQAEIEQRQREEQRELREQMREEEKARREAERARVEAEQQERKLQTALEKAKRAMEATHTADMSKHLIRIKELELQLQKIGEDKVRATSMAQLTKMGHVYVISNLGSFGDDVFKIGMTRRLDPMDRIWELSDASVPFDFDVHALIKCDDAPGLEAKLHEAFAAKRLNLINDRKEFFRVSVGEIQEVVQREGYDVQLTLIGEAKEFGESAAIRAERVVQERAGEATAPIVPAAESPKAMRSSLL